MQVAVFDLVTNNTDRKGGHILRSGERLYGIDQGLTFHVEPKLRTVVWDLGAAQVPVPWRADLKQLADAVAGRCVPELEELLDRRELAALGGARAASRASRSSRRCPRDAGPTPGRRCRASPHVRPAVQVSSLQPRVGGWWSG